jgi:two-component system, LuxR family, response regulator FixJ
VITQPAPEIVKQVIVVDNDEAVRDSLRKLMESEGFEVRAFSNGHDLLSEASLPAIGCLVVDYHMPAMNGLELVSALRRRGVSIPAILFTGNPTKYVRGPSRSNCGFGRRETRARKLSAGLCP